MIPYAGNRARFRSLWFGLRFGPSSALQTKQHASVLVRPFSLRKDIKIFIKLKKMEECQRGCAYVPRPAANEGSSWHLGLRLALCSSEAGGGRESRHHVVRRYS